MDKALGSPGTTEVAVDLGNVAYLDSSALGMLLMLRDKAKTSGKTVCWPMPVAACVRCSTSPTSASSSRSCSGGRARPRILFILVVDDNPDDLFLIRRDLAGPGHRVAGVSTAKEALAHIARAYPDVLMTDVGLPGMDGIELLQTVRMDRRQLDSQPGVLGSLDEATQMRALEAGADAYLQARLPRNAARQAQG